MGAGKGPGELVGPWEIAKMLGVTRSRFQQIALRPTFPKPYQELRATKVWLKVDVEAWIAEYRQPRRADDDVEA
ncbi:helix-turn-helix transcriptional regulator [Micromonospora sp. NPDC003816]|uniref:helix-turn-helix transcriptional regulator n=1 Tax=Micromonospora sp. NPDC003816 TaxID=3364224 RepID=UPI0036CA822D